jgi:two-component sensor histidine kinase
MSQYLQHVREEFHRSPARAVTDSHRRAVTSVDLDEAELALLIGELNHRIRNLLTMAEAVVRQTRSPTVEDYRVQVVTRISALRRFHEMDIPHGAAVDLAELLKQILRPYCQDGNQVLATGPDLQLQPKLALALHLVFHELAMNAKKHGALSSPFGFVEIRWETRPTADAARQLAIVWTEHGGPEVKQPKYFGFGSRLVTSALQAYGDVQLKFEAAGLVCCMLVDLNDNSD